MSVSVLAVLMVGASEKEAVATEPSSSVRIKSWSKLLAWELASLEPIEIDSLGLDHHALDKVGPHFPGVQAESMEGWVPALKPLG